MLSLLTLFFSCSEYPFSDKTETENNYMYTISNPVWVNDSGIVCFISRNKAKEGLLLCEMDAWTGMSTELLSKPDSIYMKGNLSLSKDKRFLLFDGATYSNYFFRRQIYRFDRLTKVMTSITNESHNENPEFSPDGSKVIFDSGYMFDDTRGVAKTHIQNADGTGRYPIDPNLNNWDRFGHFLYDGKRIVVQTSRTAMRSEDWTMGELYVMNLDGTNPVRIALGDLGSSYPYPSPVNNDLLFYDLSEIDGKAFGYKIINIDDVLKLPHISSQFLTIPITHLSIPLNVRKLNWSPDGKRIAIAGTTDTRYEKYDLYLINRDGTGFRRLTTGLNTIDFGWSDNGNFIAAVDRDPGLERLPYFHLVNTNNGSSNKIYIEIPESLRK